MSDANTKIVLPELSYEIIGSAFEVFNVLGWGYSERQYQQALAKEFSRRNIGFQREVYVPFTYKAENIGRYFADFIVDGKVLLELKVVPKFGYAHVKQVLGYLQNAKLRLGILIYFTKEGIKYRRVINPEMPSP
jgi:GxxExxY protein